MGGMKGLSRGMLPVGRQDVEMADVAPGEHAERVEEVPDGLWPQLMGGGLRLCKPQGIP
jgi:hypothetical protein